MLHDLAESLSSDFWLQVESESASANPPSEEADTSASNGSDAGSAPDGSGKPVRASMERKLTEALQPEALTILDESAQHAGHAGSRMLASPSGETHFKVSIVSSAFQGLNTVKRHRQVYEVRSLAACGGPMHERVSTFVHLCWWKLKILLISNCGSGVQHYVCGRRS